ncbi:CocE/NonD family hydrolase [Thermodesulfobacteriota bacterium]
MTCSSQYLTMRDGVRIAVDLYLPKGRDEGEVLPTIFHQTRYFRSMQLRWPFRWYTGGKPLDHTGLYGKRRKYFVTRGYAWIDADVRGSGASEGYRICPWSPDEIRDGAEIVQWVIDRPWSNGKVGAMGISYDGTTAEFLLVNNHPAVAAVAPRFSLYDVYTDMPFPGGIHGVRFSEDWHRMNNALDRNAAHEEAGSWIRLFVTGVTPVDSDRDHSILKSAVAGHGRNYNVHAEALQMRFRDDLSANDPYNQAGGTPEILAGEEAEIVGSMGLFSPHSYARDIRASGAAIYSYSGWFDGAYAHAAIKRFLATDNPGSRLILGPWNHGGGWNCDPSHGPVKADFDHEVELIRFFDHHLRGTDTGVPEEEPVHYYTMAEGEWKSAKAWPPPAGVVTYRLDSGGGLTLSEPESHSAYDEYRVDYSAGTGGRSRWRTQTGIDAAVEYADRAEEGEKLLLYTSAPLEEDTEVTGHPVVTLYVSSTADDGNFFVYLEDVDEKGRVAYVTEGLLRALHRGLSEHEPPYPHVVPYHSFLREDAMKIGEGEVAALVIDMLPTSYLFRQGHSIRLAVAGADSSHFVVPTVDPPTVRIYRGGETSSRLELPVIRH